MTLDNSSFEISLSLTGSTKAKARHIQKLKGKASLALWDLGRCFDVGEQWNDLTPVQKIVLEDYGTIKLLELIELYNRYVSHSIHYRLREKTPEEEEEDAF
jgi:hypothetical protein